VGKRAVVLKINIAGGGFLFSVSLLAEGRVPVDFTGKTCYRFLFIL
jgi:hypothetical protein